MKKAVVYSIILVITMTSMSPAIAQKLVRLTDLQQVIKEEKDKILVLNFWATWCAPCLKEMPFFEQLNAKRTDVRVILVSMDMDLDPNPEKVSSFVARKNIQSNVLILDERNPNSWINKIDKRWSGALPATLLINNRNGKRRFVEKSLAEGELEKLIEEILN